MQTVFDIIGSMFLFGIFLLSMNNLNVVVMDTMNDANISSISNYDRTNLLEVLDYDFLKMGYQKAGLKIDTTVCSARSIGWYADANRDGAMDTIRYYLSSTDSTRLQRSVNGNAMTIRTGVTKFLIRYQDSTDTVIPPSMLSASAMTLRGVGLHIEFNNQALKTEGKNNEAYLDRTYFPKSLKP